jgi:hypothetical protein
MTLSGFIAAGLIGAAGGPIRAFALRLGDRYFANISALVAFGIPGACGLCLLAAMFLIR